MGLNFLPQTTKTLVTQCSGDVEEERPTQSRNPKCAAFLNATWGCGDGCGASQRTRTRGKEFNNLCVFYG